MKTTIDKHPECCKVTYKGLYDWYVDVFEKLGWMILAKSRKLDEKIDTYKLSIQLLHQSLEKKIKELKNINKKNDLKIIKHNVKILMDHVNKDFTPLKM